MTPICCTPEAPGWQAVRARYRRRDVRRRVYLWTAVVWLMVAAIGFAPWPEWFL